MYHDKGMLSKICKGEGPRGKVRRKPASFWVSLPQGGTEDAFNPSSYELWQHVWGAICQGHALESHRPEFSLFFKSGSGHTGVLSLKCTKFLDSRKESKCSAWMILYVEFSHMGTWAILTKRWWELSWNPMGPTSQEKQSQSCSANFLPYNSLTESRKLFVRATFGRLIIHISTWKCFEKYYSIKDWL